MTIDEAMAAYKAAQTNVNSQSAKLLELSNALNGLQTDFSTGGTRVREGFVVSAKAMAVQNQQTGAINQAQSAYDVQRLVVSQAYVDKDRAKQDLNNAVIESDQSGEVEHTGPAVN